MQIARKIATWGGGKKPAYWGLCFTALADASSIRLSNDHASGSWPRVRLQYSRDGVEWRHFAGEEIPGSGVGSFPTVLLNKNEVVFVAAYDTNESTGFDPSNYLCFAMTGQIAASGDVSSLLNKIAPVVELSSTYTFTGLFSGCTSLTTAPELPATTLASYCYRQMFSGCTSLQMLLVRFSAFTPTNATTNWTSSVAASGTFTCPAALGTNETITRGTSNCPSGWTVVNT